MEQLPLRGKGVYRIKSHSEIHSSLAGFRRSHAAIMISSKRHWDLNQCLFDVFEFGLFSCLQNYLYKVGDKLICLLSGYSPSMKDFLQI